MHQHKQAYIVEETDKDKRPLTDDEIQLAKFGKAEQLKREWGPWSILAFATTNLCAWEITSSLLGPTFTNGGPVAVVYSFLASSIGIFFVDASLAEMASICPIAGAQYYWVAHFAPHKLRRILSFIQGWITTLSWQMAIIFIDFLVASQILALVTFTIPTYTLQGWHTYLMTIGVSIINCLVNTIGKSLLPKIEIMSGICHVVFLFATIIPLLALGKKNSNSFVWTSFENSGGWSSNGVSFCIGFLGPVTALAGADGCVHMSEECRRANVQVPRAMIGSLLINGTLAFVFIVVTLYSITDVGAALSSTTGYPIIEVYYQATGSAAAAVVLECFIIIIQMCAGFCMLASTSRLTWAFARDDGLPFSSFFAVVHPTLKAPIRAVLLNFAITVIISTIVIGSVVAIYAITSLGVIALFISYAIPIACFLHFRLTHETSEIHYGPWTLGRFGVPFNILGLVVCTFIVIFLPFPPVLPVTPQNMNYAGPIIGVVMVGALVDWMLRGRKVFKGPQVDMAALSQGAPRDQALLKAVAEDKARR